MVEHVFSPLPRPCHCEARGTASLPLPGPLGDCGGGTSLPTQVASRVASVRNTLYWVPQNQHKQQQTKIQTDCDSHHGLPLLLDPLLWERPPAMQAASGEAPAEELKDLAPSQCDTDTAKGGGRGEGELQSRPSCPTACQPWQPQG